MVDPYDLDEGLADLEQWLNAWITGAEYTPGLLRQKRLKAEKSEWVSGLGPIDDKETLRRMLRAVKEMQRLRKNRQSGRADS